MPRVTFLTFLVFLVDILTNLSQLVDAMDAYWDYQGEWHLGLCLCHPLAILGQNNRNYHNNLALSSSSSSSGYIGTEQLQLSQLSCLTIVCSASSSDNNGINIIMFCHSKLQELCLYSCLKSFCLNYSGLNFSALTLSFQQQK